MADWKVLAKAARNTARKQASSARSNAGVYSTAARNTVHRQAPEVSQSLRDSGTRARRTTAAYTAVAGRRVRRARLGTRLKNALRDALLMGVSIGVIWFVVTRTGIQIPVPVLIGVILVLMLVRFGYALFARTDTTVDDDNAWGDEDGEGETADPDAERAFDPRDTAAPADAPKSTRRSRR